MDYDSVWPGWRPRTPPEPAAPCCGGWCSRRWASASQPDGVRRACRRTDVARHQAQRRRGVRQHPRPARRCRTRCCRPTTTTGSSSSTTPSTRATTGRRRTSTGSTRCGSAAAEPHGRLGALLPHRGALADLGRLVQLEHLLGGGGGQFDANAAHLPPDQRRSPRSSLKNLRRALTETLRDPAPGVRDRCREGRRHRQGGLRRGDPAAHAVARCSRCSGRPAATLSPALERCRRPDADAAVPRPSRFDAGDREVKPGDLHGMWEVMKACSRPGGRLDPVEQNRRSVVRRLAAPCGSATSGTPTSSSTRPTSSGATFPAAAARDGLRMRSRCLDPRLAGSTGADREMGNLIIAAFALLEDKQFQVRGAHVDGLGPRRRSATTWCSSTHACPASRPGIRPPSEPLSCSAFSLASCAPLPTWVRWAGSLARRRAPTDTVPPAGRGPTEAPEDAGAHPGLRSPDHREHRGCGGRRPLHRCGRRLQGRGARSDVGTGGASSVGEVHEQRRGHGWGIDGHDWTTLDAVAEAADAGDESAQQAVTGLREAAAAEELHIRLLSRLPAAHTAATQWLLANRPSTTGPTGGPNGPDDVELEIDGDRLSAEMAALQGKIQQAIGAERGSRVRITWRVL